MPDTTMLFHMVQGGPKPVAPFSHAVECDGWVFVTGQMPDSPADPGRLPEGIEAQTRNVMANLGTVLGGVGLGLEHVTMVRIYLTHFHEDYARMNEVYASFFSVDRRPARTCIGTTGLAYATGNLHSAVALVQAMLAQAAVTALGSGREQDVDADAAGTLRQLPVHLVSECGVLLGVPSLDMGAGRRVWSPDGQA